MQVRVVEDKVPHVDGLVEEEEAPQARAGLESLEQVQKLIRKLPGREREVVRLFYLEGRTYEEISIELNLPVKTIGPVLKRARKLLRRFESSSAVVHKPPKSASEGGEKKEG